MSTVYIGVSTGRCESYPWLTATLARLNDFGLAIESAIVPVTSIYVLVQGAFSLFPWADGANHRPCHLVVTGPLYPLPTSSKPRLCKAVPLGLVGRQAHHSI